MKARPSRSNFSNQSSQLMWRRRSSPAPPGKSMRKTPTSSSSPVLTVAGTPSCSSTQRVISSRSVVVCVSDAMVSSSRVVSRRDTVAGVVAGRRSRTRPTEETDGSGGRWFVHPGAKQAELVALRVGEHDPGLLALPDVDPCSTEAEQAIQLFGLLHADRIDVEVNAVLDRFLFGDRLEQQSRPRGLTVADLDRTIVLDAEH